MKRDAAKRFVIRVSSLFSANFPHQRCATRTCLNVKMSAAIIITLTNTHTIILSVDNPLLSGIRGLARNALTLIRTTQRVKPQR